MLFSSTTYSWPLLVMAKLMVVDFARDDSTTAFDRFEAYLFPTIAVTKWLSCTLILILFCCLNASSIVVQVVTSCVNVSKARKD